MKRFTADFETATWIDDESYVWAWALCDIEDPEKVDIGNSIDSFFERIKKEHNPYVYFHNLKFDGEFILYYLMKNGYEHVEKKERRTNTFSTLISDMGLFYQIEVYFDVGKKTKKVTFIDSLKIINQTVESMPKTFKIPENKLEIDYNLPREVGHILTKEETDYVKNDVVIVAKALSYLFSMGLTRMTAGSNALGEYKNIMKLNRFRNLYKPLNYEIDKDIRRAYRGGFTYCNPEYKGKTTGEGEVLDVNSLYPSVMYNEILPFGEPFFYNGAFQPLGHSSMSSMGRPFPAPQDALSGKQKISTPSCIIIIFFPSLNIKETVNAITFRLFRVIVQLLIFSHVQKFIIPRKLTAICHFLFASAALHICVT